jgi:hypothetical protein
MVLLEFLRKVEAVFFLPNGTTCNAQETQRHAVIKAASLQEHYNVPVSNKFSNLLD